MRTILIVGMLGVVCRCIATGADEPKLAAPKPAVISVEPAKVKQTLDGFGVSGGWWSQSVGTWPKTRRAKVLELLFGKTGIGLSIFRYNLGAGKDKTIRDPWRSAHTLETVPGKFDLNRDRAAIAILREAIALGVKHVELFACSPPARLTKNGLTHGGKQPNGEFLCNLRDDAYDDFAAYLVGATKALRDASIPVQSLSPVNEPQWRWDKSTQEGCYYTPAQMVRLLRAVAAELDKQKAKVAIAAPDAGAWGATIPYAKAIFRDKILNKRIHQIGVHSYFSGPNSKRAFARWMAKYFPGKTVAMTEWCELTKGHDFTMDSALVLAKTVLDDLTIGRASSWQYWLGASKNAYRDGLIYVDERTKTHAPTKRLWALGQFSRILRPGWRVVECNSIGKARACGDQP